jgi:hypothetical protein
MVEKFFASANNPTGTIMHLTLPTNTYIAQNKNAT